MMLWMLRWQARNIIRVCGPRNILAFLLEGGDLLKHYLLGGVGALLGVVITLWAMESLSTGTTLFSVSILFTVFVCIRRLVGWNSLLVNRTHIPR